MSLYQKGMLAFALVILIAVATVLLLVSRQAEREFRQYALLYSGRVQNIGAALIAYYRTHGSWAGIQEALPTLAPTAGGQQGQGGRGAGRGGPTDQAGSAEAWDFRVADAAGNVVAHLAGQPGTTLSAGEQAWALPLAVDGETVGYLLPDAASARSVVLGGPEQQYLARVRTALWTGAAVAFVAALLVGGLLMRGIVAPVRRLTQAAEQIAQGELEVRAAVATRDEIGQLGDAFNTMAESLARSQAARRAQTADIAHELRTPLAVLRGTLEAIADGVYPPTPDNLDLALAQVQTLTRLVEDLRVLALADAGELRLERQLLDVRLLLSHEVEVHRLALQAQGLTLHGVLPPALPLVSGDSDRLAQVVGNLLSNAARYVPAGGEVWVTAVGEDQGVTVRVSDNGPGVPADDLPRLFERFWRGDPSRNRSTGGSGLGLAIARRIIEAHGGRIWATPTPGGGLTVAFWLPGAEARPSPL
ncbi:MAG TPA: ATP-binding protein [Anaerolineae bacterium]|nr:ATP-binding protein [Anaerolineae bacterium]